MSLKDRITRALSADIPALQRSAQRRSIGPLVYAPYQYGKPVWNAQSLSTYFGYYDQVVVAFACINLIADAASAARVRVYDSALDGVEVKDHPLRALLSKPNTYMSEAEFYNVMVKMAAIAGFSIAEKERNRVNGVIGLHPLRSDWLKPIPRENNMTDWQYTLPNGQKKLIAAEDVIAWTYQASPTMSALGTTSLGAASREIGIENAMTNFIKAFFDGGGVPMIGLVPDPDAPALDPAEADALREAFMQLASEPWHPIMLQAIKDVKRIGLDLNEMAYQDLRDLTATQICTAFRVPAGMVGVLAGMERNTFSNYQEQRLSFYEDTIIPLWSRLDGALTRSLLPDFDVRPSINLEFDTSNIPAFDEDDSADWAKVGTAVSQGWVTLNDARQIVKLPRVKSGDVFLRSIAVMEVAAVEQNSSRSLRASITELERVPADHSLGAGAEFDAQRHHAMQRVSREARSRIAATHKQQIARIAERGSTWLRKFFGDQGERILREMGLRAMQDGTIAPDLQRLEARAVEYIDWDAEERLLKQQVSQIHTLAGQSAFEIASEITGVDVAWTLANPNINRVLSQLSRRVVDINASTRDDVQRVIADSLQSGSSLSDIADNLRGLFEETYTSRSETIARTESQVAYNSASTLGYRESGVVAMVELVDNPEHTEDYNASDGLTCAERDGLLVELDAVASHIEAEHPNGSLTVIPVLKASDE
jgi:HK97 family phage portal protein